jgi:hypothetical protein
MKTAENVAGLKALFENKEEIESQPKMSRKVAHKLSVAGQRDKDIEGVYKMDCLNPVQRYKHSHKAPDKKVVEITPKDIKSTKHTKRADGTKRIKVILK